MSFALSFGPEFFWGDGSVDPKSLKRVEQPTSVYQALLNLTEHEWACLARDVFHVEPEYLEPETVMAKIQETNTCRNLDPPVEILIDAEGWYSVLVYDRKEGP